MKSEKHLQKREEIVDTAFRAWGKSCYMSTSLNDIAESLKMTKQAIYRYFKGKNGLIDAMEERVTEKYRENYYLIREKMETQSREEAVITYIMNQIIFFRNHTEYLTFLISKVRLNRNQRDGFQALIQEQNLFLRKFLGIPAIAVTYMLNLTVFYLFMGDKESPEHLTSRINIILHKGFGTGLLKTPEHTEKLLEENKLPEVRQGEENKILKAISEVVLEEGPHHASVEKIARRAGMTKSSLYFYFRNKEQMIVETINGQTEQFAHYYYKKLSEYKEIAEQLFAHFVITASMTIEMPHTVSLIHWFIQRGIGEQFRKPTEIENYRVFFENAAKNGYLDTHGVTAEQLLLLVNFCVTFEINNETNKDLDKEEKYGLVKGLFELFVHGLDVDMGE